MELKRVYFEGETIELSSSAGIETRCYAVCGDSKVELRKTNNVWTGRIPTSGLSGSYHVRIFKEDSNGSVWCEGASRVVVAPGRSSHRDRAESIQSALEAWAKNPNATITVGEISISYKNVAELRAEYQTELSKAESEESGRVLTGGPKVIRSRY